MIYPRAIVNIRPINPKYTVFCLLPVRYRVTMLESINSIIYVLNPYSANKNKEITGKIRLNGYFSFKRPKLFDIKIKEYPKTNRGVRDISRTSGAISGSFPVIIMLRIQKKIPTI